MKAAPKSVPQKQMENWENWVFCRPRLMGAENAARPFAMAEWRGRIGIEKLNLRVDMLLTLNWSLMHIKMKSIQHVKQNTCNLWHLPKGRFTWSFDQMAAVVVFWCVCAVVHERFTPCLLQNKVVSCSMRLNIICQRFRTFFYKMEGPSTYPLMSLNQWAL